MLTAACNAPLSNAAPAGNKNEVELELVDTSAFDAVPDRADAPQVEPDSQRLWLAMNPEERLSGLYRCFGAKDEVGDIGVAKQPARLGRLFRSILRDGGGGVGAGGVVDKNGLESSPVAPIVLQAGAPPIDYERQHRRELPARSDPDIRSAFAATETQAGL
jgi:hypothetical protein